MGQSRKVPVRWIAVGTFVLLALAAATVGWRASRALRLSKEEVHSEREIRFLVRPLALPGNVNFASITVTAEWLPVRMRPCYFSGLQTPARRRKFWSRPPPARPVNETANLCHKKWKGAIAKSSRPSFAVGVLPDVRRS